jgi:hypothetical protein
MTLVGHLATMGRTAAPASPLAFIFRSTFGISKPPPIALRAIARSRLTCSRGGRLSRLKRREPLDRGNGHLGMATTTDFPTHYEYPHEYPPQQSVILAAKLTPSVSRASIIRNTRATMDVRGGLILRG